MTFNPETFVDNLLFQIRGPAMLIPKNSTTYQARIERARLALSLVRKDLVNGELQEAAWRLDVIIPALEQLKHDLTTHGGN